MKRYEVIPEIVEGKNIVIPDYSGKKFSDEEVQKNAHRSFVTGAGAKWEEGGRGQLDFMIAHGLKPHHKLVDIGCGALRAGRHFVDYLDVGNYYGVDANYDLVSLGYNKELTDEQRARLPVPHLRVNERFDVNFGVNMDFAIAQSVFTHVSLNHVILCLHRLAKVMKPGGLFFASIFEQSDDLEIDHIYQLHPKGRTYFFEKNLFWYRPKDMRLAASTGPWEYEYVGDYGSPQHQFMVSFRRLKR
jgi:SAM-dependent methyltransferase